jgi:hypothetical protein
VPQTSNLKRGWSQGLGCAAGSWLAAKGATHWHRETTIFFNCVISNTNPSQASETAAPFKLAGQQSPPAQSQPPQNARQHKASQPAQRATVAAAQRMVSGHSGTPTLLGELLTVTVGGCGLRWSGDVRLKLTRLLGHSDARLRLAKVCLKLPIREMSGENERGSSSKRPTLFTHSRIGTSCARTCCKLLPITALQPRTGLPTLA